MWIKLVILIILVAAIIIAYQLLRLPSEREKLIALRTVSSALRSGKIPFFLVSGTALGAHREGRFISHDTDVDLGVFSDLATLDEVVTALTNAGISIFKQYDNQLVIRIGACPVDIFMFTRGPPHLYYSYGGVCSKHPNKRCVFANSFKLQPIRFYGDTYQIPSQDFLVQAYGPDWRTPRKFSYSQGIKTNSTPI